MVAAAAAAALANGSDVDGSWLRARGDVVAHDDTLSSATRTRSHWFRLLVGDDPLGRGPPTTSPTGSLPIVGPNVTASRRRELAPAVCECAAGVVLSVSQRKWARMSRWTTLCIGVRA